ncbi:MAG TPA: hypothetical protein VH333_05165 [Pseudonocardiaceae bacterium]|jgi:coproporphyrinogen III oxidase-like Fe-S oxidoreductase|nr:hypothetical protein [Pseudonocardiaceae bacterium]
MVGETEEKWLASLAKAIEFMPDSVTIYHMEVPHNTTLHARLGSAGTADMVADWPTKRRWTEHAFSALEQAGYQVGSGYTMSRAGRDSDFVYPRQPVARRRSRRHWRPVRGGAGGCDAGVPGRFGGSRWEQIVTAGRSGDGPSGRFRRIL